MKVGEAELLKANAEMLNYKALYFQARDEIRKANKGLARLSRNNQRLKDQMLRIVAERPEKFTQEVIEMFERGGVVAAPATPRLTDAIRQQNGNGVAHVSY